MQIQRIKVSNIIKSFIIII